MNDAVKYINKQTYRYVASKVILCFGTLMFLMFTYNGFRFCAAIHRENFPYERVLPAYKWVQPAHTITLLSPITIVNLLPYDLHFAVKDAPSNSAGRIKPGQSASLTQVAH
jgi:vacuolar protein sorting-associated protein 13D